VSASQERKSRAHAADCRFSNFDCRLPPIEARQDSGQGQDRSILNRKSSIDNCQGALTLRDVKNEGTTGDVYENKGDGDRMSSEKHGFYTKMHKLREDQQKSVGFLGRECTDYAIIRGEGIHKIGPSVHRFIDPSEEHGVGFRWPDDRGLPLCIRNKRGYPFIEKMSESFISFK
jgi:hypothetical protein